MTDPGKRQNGSSKLDQRSCRWLEGCLSTVGPLYGLGLMLVGRTFSLTCLIDRKNTGLVVRVKGGMERRRSVSPGAVSGYRLYGPGLRPHRAVVSRVKRVEECLGTSRMEVAMRQAAGLVPEAGEMRAGEQAFWLAEPSVLRVAAR